MDTKTPAVMIVLVDADHLRWYVAETTWNCEVSPLLRSLEGDLAPCLELAGDERVAFLRHRFSGVLQRGCNSLWSRMKKPCRIVFVFDGRLGAEVDLLEQRMAEHFVEWMANPPLLFLILEQRAGLEREKHYRKLAGELTADLDTLLTSTLPQLLVDADKLELWELSQKQICRPTTEATSPCEA